METAVAFVVDHASVDAPPAAMADGDAVNVTCGMPGVFTVTVAVAVLVPPAPDAVSVYVVVEPGVTTIDPLRACAPMPWSIETLVAFVVVHESVEEPPAEIAEGLAVNVALGVTALLVRLALSKRPNPEPPP